MTREGESLEAAKKFEQSLYDSDVASLTRSDMGFAYMSGIRWADENPKEWISVEESLPKQDEEVIVLCDELNTAPCYKIAFGHIVDKTICKDYNGWNIPNVVYWLPMPKLPKE